LDSDVIGCRSHIAIVEKLDGKSADWMEQVSDKKYRERITNQ
jgi:hypothetical protein